MKGLISKAWGRLSRCFRQNRLLWVIVLLLFAQRLAYMICHGAEYGLGSDDLSYVLSGIHFANTGTVSIHTQLPTAQIMPGMPVLIGVFSLIFGEGQLLWLMLKLAWLTMGSLTAFVAGKIVSMFAPRIYGALTACLFLLPNFVWMDNLLLTETPYIFFFALALWAAVQMGRQKRFFYLFLACFFCAYMLRANAIALPVFVGAYLLATGYDRPLLLRQAATLVLALALFTIPWSIRNYIQFRRFIPTTYGTGNAMLLGTYQGRGFPPDDTLDYETHVEAVLRERFARYYNASGQPKEEKYVRMLNLERDLIQAEYRMQVWWARAPKSMVFSYAYLKPRSMLISVFYWEPVRGIPAETLRGFRAVEFFLFLLSILSALALKKNRAVILTLAAYYFVNLAIYAYGFAFDRYAELIIINRYLVVGMGLPLLPELGGRIYRTWIKHEGPNA